MRYLELVTLAYYKSWWSRGLEAATLWAREWDLLYKENHKSDSDSLLSTTTDREVNSRWPLTVFLLFGEFLSNKHTLFHKQIFFLKNWNWLHTFQNRSKEPWLFFDWLNSILIYVEEMKVWKLVELYYFHSIPQISE